MKRCIFTIIVLLSIVGCQGSLTPTTTDRPDPTVTVQPTATALPTPTIPSLDTTNKGYPLVVLDGPEGALYRLGMGWRDKEAAVSPDSRLLALPATTGLYVYQADDLELVWAATGKSFVLKAVWSPDGSRVIALHDDSTVSIFDASDGSLLYQFPVDTSSSFSLPQSYVEISPDNQLLFAGKRLYDVASGEELACAYCPKTYDPDYDAYLAFTVDSVLRAARPCDEATFCLWDSDSGEGVPYPQPGVQEGGPISISPDGNWVLVQADNTIRLFDVQTENYHLITELTDAPFEKYFLPESKSITWAPDSSAFIIQSDERTYLFQTGAEVSTLNWVDRVPVAWSPDSSLIMYSRRYSVVLYEASSGKSISEAEGGSARALLDNGSILWEYYFNRDYYGLVVSKGNEADYDHSLVLNIDAVNLVSAGWTPDNLLLIAADQPEFLFLDGATGKPVAAPEADFIPTQSPSQRDFQWSAAGSRLVWLVNDQYVKVLMWDRATSKKYNSYGVRGHKIDSIAFSLDGRRLLVGSDKQSAIILFDVESAEILHQINEDDYNAHGLVDLAFSPDGSQFASVDEGTIEPITVWETESFTPLYTLMPDWEDRTYIRTINWAGDLIAGHGYNDVFVWRASTQSLLWSASLEPSDNDRCRWILNNDIDNRMALSADGRYLAVVTGGASQGCDQIAVYDAHTGELLHQYPGNNTTSITRLAWSPDGQYLVSVAHKDTFVVWDTSLLPPVEIP